MRQWTEDAIEKAENVVYLAVAVVLVAVAAVVLGSTAVKFTELPDLGVISMAAEVLDLLLLVFIVVELLYAVRTTLAERELVAEPFLIVGIIASIKEIVVLSVKAPDYVGTDKLDGHRLADGRADRDDRRAGGLHAAGAPQGARAQRGRRQRPRRRPREAGRRARGGVLTARTPAVRRQTTLHRFRRCA